MAVTRIIVAAVCAVFTFSLAGCAETGVTVQDAYKIGCPAIDAAAASGSVAGKAALAGLEELRDSGAVTGEVRPWLDAAIEFLSSDDPGAVSDATREVIISGCAENGYSLQNLG